jgi:capsular polysaccharide transport system permease protein
LCALSVFTSSADRIVGPFMRPLFWVSGIFFTANALPTNYLSFLIYNPVLHIVEIVRDGWYVGYTAKHASFWYPSSFILMLSFFGLTLERVARRRLELA